MKSQRHSDSSKAFDDIYRDPDFSDVGAIIRRHEEERGRFLSELKEMAKEEGGRAKRVLEVGCGTAVDLLHVADARMSAAYGVDLSWQALSVARNVGKQFARVAALFVQADAHCLPFENEAFDLVFSQGVLEHLKNDREAIKEQARVLKKGGRLVISVPQKYTAYTVMKHFKIRRGSWPWGYETEYSCGQLRSLAVNLRLSEKSAFGYGYWLHPAEPTWVARSLVAKFQKINPARASGLFVAIQKRYDRWWSWLEKKFGRLFMRNVVIVLEK